MIKQEVIAECLESRPAAKGNAHELVLVKRGAGYQGADQFLPIRCGGKMRELGESIKAGDKVKALVVGEGRAWTNPQGEVVYFPGFSALSLVAVGKERPVDRTPGEDDGDGNLAF